MSLLDKKHGTPCPHQCPEAYSKALRDYESRPETQPAMKQITKIITETKYDPKVVAFEVLCIYGFVSLGIDLWSLAS